MNNAYYVELQGTSGGFALWWKYEINIRILGVDHNIIDSKVKLKNQRTPMWVSCIYAKPDFTRRQCLWNLL